MYSIKAVSQSTGLSTDTLRAWERRYGAVRPRRDDNDRRVYDSADVARLKLLRRATELGHPISRIADLSDGKLQELSESADEPAQWAAARLVKQLVTATERYDSFECERVLATAMALMPPASLVRDVISPALREIGDRWHRGSASIAQERILSSTIRRLVTGVFTALDRSSSGPAIVFATLSGELHEIGALSCAYLAASRGIRCFYLGPDLPAEELARVASETKASAVCVSLVRSPRPEVTVDQLRTLSRELPKSCEIWAGGPAALIVREHGSIERCWFLADQQALEDRLETLAM